MKYSLLLLLLCSLYACGNHPASCLPLTGEEVSVEIEVKHNITENSISYPDTIDLSITFPKNLINTKNSGTFDISEQEPRFALFIQRQDEDKGYGYYFAPAKDQFEYSILKGEEISISRYYFAPAAEEAINIRPEFSQDQYALNIQLFYPKEPGNYKFYWHFLHRDFLLFDSEDLSQLPSCKDFIKVKINNLGVANLHIGEGNSSPETDSMLRKEFGMLFIDID